jgi:hypothetical protein
MMASRNCLNRLGRLSLTPGVTILYFLLWLLLHPAPSFGFHISPVPSQLSQKSIYKRSTVTSIAMAADASSSDDDDDQDLSVEAFQQAKRQNEVAKLDEEFDGYALRDVILEKWGKCYDVDFNRVDSFGFRGLYLNILPFHLGGRRFRHESEYDYLCHLQAVVEILAKYNQVRKIVFFFLFRFSMILRYCNIIWFLLVDWNRPGTNRRDKEETSRWNQPTHRCSTTIGTVKRRSSGNNRVLVCT